MKKIIFIFITLICTTHANILDDGIMSYNTGDYKKAFDLFYQSCDDNGNAQGCNNLGLLYDEGKGVDKNTKMACTYYSIACDNGETRGCINLAISYRKGFGVPKNKKKAFKLLSRACDNGNPEGCSRLGRLYEMAFGVPKNIKTAIHLYSIACDKGDAIGCSYLGSMYLDGVGIRQDKKKAKSLFGISCDSGYQEGCDNYKKIINSSKPLEFNDFSETANTRHTKIENELLNLKSTKSIDISEYLLKYADTQQFSDKERNHFYSKYDNQYVEVKMTIFSIEKIDSKLYYVQASTNSGDSDHIISANVFATVYTKNKEEDTYLKNYRTGDDYPFEEHETVLLKGKFKAQNGTTKLGNNLEPAIITILGK